MNNKEPMVASIPHIQCPRCGTIMRLARVEPSFQGMPQTATFECHCGFTYQQTERARAAL
jgi:transposase-like protein